MHTLLIDGVAIAVTDADREEAEALFGSDGFKDDLRTLTAEGKPLWDGAAAFVIREASEDEAALFDDFDDEDFEDDEDDTADLAEVDGEEVDLDDDDEDEDEDDDEDAFEVMFLVPVDQFPDEEV